MRQRFHLAVVLTNISFLETCINLLFCGIFFFFSFTYFFSMNSVLIDFFCLASLSLMFKYCLRVLSCVFLKTIYYLYALRR